jgi:density-regulated protein DRP1
MTDTIDAADALLPRRDVLYCGACGMPLEYCSYGPDWESHCVPWWKGHHLGIYRDYMAEAGVAVAAAQTSAASSAVTAKAMPHRPADPWTTAERLTQFYLQYVPEKVDGVEALLEKYAGKEEKLFDALVQKYGPEPDDPYYEDSDDEAAEEEDAAAHDNAPAADEAAPAGVGKKLRRGAAAKKTTKIATRVVVQKVSQRKKRHLTVIQGLDTVPGCKLKDASKALSKKFAGSSSVKKNAAGQEEIILQGDHLYSVAELLVDTYGVPATAVYLDIDGDIMPLRG